MADFEVNELVSKLGDVRARIGRFRLDCGLTSSQPSLACRAGQRSGWIAVQNCLYAGSTVRPLFDKHGASHAHGSRRGTRPPHASSTIPPQVEELAPRVFDEQSYDSAMKQCLDQHGDLRECVHREAHRSAVSGCSQSNPSKQSKPGASRGTNR
jgi:hypothetical protein